MLCIRWKKERYEVESNSPSQKETGGKKETAEAITWLVSACGYRYEAILLICVQMTARQYSSTESRKVAKKENNPSLEGFSD